VRALGYFIVFVVMTAVAAAAFLLAFGVSTVIGIAASAAATVRCLTPSAPVEHLRLSPTAGEDPAQRAYLAGPVLRDLRRLALTAVHAAHNRLLALSDTAAADSLLTRLLWRIQQLIGESPVWLFPTAGLTAGLLAGFAAAVLLTAVTVAVHTVLVVAVVLAVRTAGGGLRWFEVTALTLRGLSTECGHCHQRLTRPVFLCGCGQAHNNLMPGDQGVLRRTCLQCGYRLPTLLVTGKRALRAQCGLCGAALPDSPQLDPTMHLPVVGGMAAGKSVFMHTAVARLDQERERHHFTPADHDTARRLAQARDLLRTATLLPPTPVGQPVVAYTVRIGPKPHRRLVHLYDAAGEILERAEHRAVSAFLGLTGGVLLVVDPFSLPAVFSRADPATLRAARPSMTDPKTILDGLIETLTETRGTNFPIPLAVVITKADALLTVPALPHPYAGVAPTPPARSAAARQWLIDHGRIDVVNSAHNHFPEVRYFVVTYRDADQVLPHRPMDGGDLVTHDDPAAPILWLLDR
jgi:Double-GTPase 2